MSTHSTRMAYLADQQPQLRLRASAWATLRAMLSARRTRRLLAAMDDRMLADVGLGRGDAITEAARPMWDIDTLR